MHPQRTRAKVKLLYIGDTRSLLCFPFAILWGGGDQVQTGLWLLAVDRLQEQQCQDTGKGCGGCQRKVWAEVTEAGVKPKRKQREHELTEMRYTQEVNLRGNCLVYVKECNLSMITKSCLPEQDKGKPKCYVELCRYVWANTSTATLGHSLLVWLVNTCLDPK